MGLFGGGDDIQPELINLDPIAQAALDQNIKDATTKTAEDYQKESMQGVHSQPIDSQSIQQKEQAMGGYEPGISGAIQNRYKGIVGENLQALKTKAQLQSNETQAMRLQKAHVFHTAKLNIDAENKRRIFEAQSANDNARNAALAGIIGVVFTVAGAALGGPAGAAVGAGVGKAVAPGQKEIK